MNRSQRSGRWKPALRLALFCAVTVACIVLWVQRRSMAERYFTQPVAEFHSAPQWDSVTVNGQRFSTSTGNTGLPLVHVLDSFQTWCRPRAGNLLQWKESLRQPGVLRPDLETPYPLVRSNDGQTGMATCVFLGPDPRVDLEARLRAASRHADLGLVGQLRHIYAHKNGEGTSFMILWSEGSLQLDEFVPAPGRDVPGLDSPGVPRPDGSRRALSGSHDNGGKRVNAYVSELDVDELRAGYQSSLARSGFRVIPMRSSEATALVALRGSRLLWISISRFEGLGTVATVIDDAGSTLSPVPEELAWK